MPASGSTFQRRNHNNRTPDRLESQQSQCRAAVKRSLTNALCVQGIIIIDSQHLEKDKHERANLPEE